MDSDLGRPRRSTGRTTGIIGTIRFDGRTLSRGTTCKRGTMRFRGTTGSTGNAFATGSCGSLGTLFPMLTCRTQSGTIADCFLRNGAAAKERLRYKALITERGSGSRTSNTKADDKASSDRSWECFPRFPTTPGRSEPRDVRCTITLNG